MADLLAAALAASDPAARSTSSGAFAKAVVGDAKLLKASGAVDALKAALEGTDAVKRESALSVIDALAQRGGSACEPYVISLLPIVLERCADKVPSVRTTADAAVRAIGASVNADSLKRLLPTLFDGMASARQWQTKEAALNVLKTFVERAPLQMCACLTEVVPKVSECMWDTRPTVITTATATMTAVCSVVGNRDLEAFLPIIVACIAKPTEVPDCIHKLSATVFVQEVETPALAIMVPLLERGLRERQTAIKRKTALIIDNMCKLVEDPTAAAPFLPKLLPGLERLAAEVADPECRTVCSKAQATLILAAGGKDAADVKRADEKAVQGVLVEQVTGKCDIDDFVSVSLDHVASLCTFLSDRKCFDFDTWHKKAVSPYISAFVAADVCEAAARALLARCIEDTRVEKVATVDDDEGEDLCNCEFSLAYGGKILLNNATLWLKRGRRYGLCGPNGAGKSTLMQAIANGQLEGFPPPEILKTVYVEHDIQGDLADLNVIDYVFADPKLAKESREEVVRVLSSVGFTDAMQQAGVTSLSGGWKMKLALARAMLTRADIFLLDEPTNHLDVKNVAWIENFLIGLKDVTCMLVSHDSGFLDRVCTDIIHYENRKLKRYKGNLSEFVKQKPEARSYYELSAATIKFTFPEPGFLEGVKTKDKGILKMTRVGFKYPTSDRMIVQNVSIYCSLSTRVAIHGANGAGKSTMIKLLTGELEPLEGTVWKHPNLRMAYVAQHAFHHIEEHLDKTPNQYIQWRYALGEDREEAEKVYRQVSKEEEEKMAQSISINGVKVVVELLLGRRKLKNSYEYEVQWIGLSPDKNMWLPRSQLEAMGFGKMVQEIDAKEAARLGLYARPLTQAVIAKHLEDFGLEPEFSTHSLMAGLSGGQKVKVVLGAAMWNNPHMLILDEPTNYLDRDSLGALAGAIREYGGGVLLITHNNEFSSALCQETWTVADGVLTAEGGNQAAREKIEWKPEAEEIIDALGNTIKIKKKLTKKELKQKQKERKARIARGEDVSSEEEE
jgi:elongation factor 3